MKTLLKNAHLICPVQQFDGPGYLGMADGQIIACALGTIKDESSYERIIDCKGHIVAPGLIDMRVQSADPGEEHLETLDSLLSAAAHGGITSLVTLPDTDPVIDNRAMIDSLSLRASRRFGPRLYLYGALTKGQKGHQMAELGMMANAGAVGFASGRHSIQDSLIMRRLMTYAAMFDKPVIHHCEDYQLTDGGEMNEGETATRLGLIGMPAEAEAIIVQRDIALARLTKSRYHIAHISTAAALDAVRLAKADGVAVTCDTAPPYALLNEHAVNGYNTAFKLSPPLRSEGDRLAVLQALSDGTIDALASDHSPVNYDEKAQPFGQASNGASGLETLFPTLMTMVANQSLSLLQAITLTSTNPARILGIAGGSLETGLPADVICFDPHSAMVIDQSRFLSRSRISPFHGQPAHGKICHSFVGGNDILEA
ncbi:MAG: dihydroorotase [Candidatus Puniceispirillaceae bacterium]